MTLEHTVGRAVMRAAGADERLTPDRASVQHLADAVSMEGTRITVGTNETWVGMPLRGHFRCADPMFGIANTISYGGTMVRLREAAPSGPGCGSLTTHWIDVPLASGRHWGPDDERALVDLLGGFEEPPGDLFVIAPFRDAIYGARDATTRMVSSRRAPVPLGQRWKEWTAHAIGTVHTFQGREADTVILLLSAAAERPRARAWAASPPNLLNVAVTRAREHLIVIGNRVAWSSEPFGAEIANLVQPAARSGAASPWPPPTRTRLVAEGP